MSKDYYKILGVEKNATEGEVNKAYRRKALEHHPDRNPGDEEAAAKFKECAEAFEILSDPNKRQEYDQFGSISASRGHSSFHTNPFEIFENIFGDVFEERRPQRGADMHQEVHISLEEAFQGCKRIVTSCSHVACEPCEGTGVAKWEPCKACGGSGRLQQQKGPFSISITCTRCHGRGKMPVVLCDKCDGSGKVACKAKEHTIDFPPGVEHGTYVRLHGQGEMADNGYVGDLIVSVAIDPHIFYERDGQDLFCILPIPYSQAILGHQIELPLLSGKMCNVKIPPGVTSGSVLRVSGVGMPVQVDRMRREIPYGDLLVRIEIQQPDNPSEKYLDLVKKLCDLDDNEIYGRIQQLESCISEMCKQE